ncbi:MobF family relaxase [Streptacidiphilus sp. N1-12]|uniref:MobF family relaxase n=1 Tax=Streptacidiphilus alkalitolerans TaxID=3342712 RepID=A0ABV6WRA1_9ACTN
MAHITPIKNTRQVRYWTRKDVGCPTSGVLARPVVWSGAGLARVGLSAGTAVDPEMASELLWGRHPITGRTLRRLRTVTHDHALLDATAFAQALRERAAAAGREPVELLRSQRSKDRWKRLENGLGKRKPEPLVPVKDLDRLAKDARLPLGELYPAGVLGFARRHRDARKNGAVLGHGHTFNFVKSLSALLAIAPPWMVKVIMEEVEAVGHEVVAAAEVFTGYGVTGEQGRGHLAARIEGEGLLAVMNPHAQARPTKGHPGDPSLHLHVTFVNAIWCRDSVWRSFGSSGQDLRRYNAVLGEFAKARLRARLHDRLGIRFERDPKTRESEAVGIPLKLREAWSKRSKAIRAKAGPGASAARRRVAAMQLAQVERRRQGRRVWDPAVLLDLWRTEARTTAGDLDQAVATTAPGRPRTRTAEPTMEEVLARLWLPRRAAVRRKGCERREVLAAVIATYPDNLRSLHQAQEMTDRIIAQVFTLLPVKSGTNWIETERYRVPPDLVATSKNPLHWNDPRRPSRGSTPATTAAVLRRAQLDRARPPLPLALPSPVQPEPRPGPAPRPVAADRTDQVQLDLGLDAAAPVPVVPPDRFGQLTIEDAIAEATAERPHKMTGDLELAEQVAAAEQALAQAEQAAADHELDALQRIADADAGLGDLAVALRRRRSALAAAAALKTEALVLLDRAADERRQAAAERKRAAGLQELHRRRWLPLGADRAKAARLLQDPGKPLDPEAAARITRKGLPKHIERLERSAKDRDDAAEVMKTTAKNLTEAARTEAGRVHDTVEAALLEARFTEREIEDQDGAARAADTAAARAKHDQDAAADAPKVADARQALKGLRTEVDLRARMTARQRVDEEQERRRAREEERAALGARPAPVQSRAVRARDQQAKHPGSGQSQPGVKR